MINNFKETFGTPDKTIVCIGDFEQKHHMKYKEPIKGKSMRTLFRRNGYQVYLVDEYRTSCMCSKCEEGRCEKFMKRSNPRPFRRNNKDKDEDKEERINLVHGVLICKKCGAVWNRDVNAATNIYKIAKSAINNNIPDKKRPDYLKRSIKKDDTNNEKEVKKKIKLVLKNKISVGGR
jgi:hypothetical protein